MVVEDAASQNHSKNYMHTKDCKYANYMSNVFFPSLTLEGV